MATINGTSYTSGSHAEAVAMYDGLVEAQANLASGHEEVLFAGRKYRRSNMEEITAAIKFWLGEMRSRAGSGAVRLRRLVPRDDR